jgi:predicted aspartyl protease/Skp family chaperone for outer membrane proteins
MATPGFIRKIFYPKMHQTDFLHFRQGIPAGMRRNARFTFSVMLALCLGLFLTPDLKAEFYKYVDREGRVFYVDDLSKIPEEYQEQVKVYREKYDELSEQDRARALESERARIQQAEQEQQRQIIEQLREFQETEEADKKRKAAEDEQKLLEKMQTEFIVDGNRILVPVTLANNGIEVGTHLLLDTGASQIVLHREFAGQLNIIALKKGLAQVVGGQNIYVETGEISYFKVGPYTMEKAEVLIVAHEGEAVSYSGLLGMNFLKNVAYTIDYQKQVIRWLPPPQETEGQQSIEN